jgi:hypothetical protein
MPLRALAAHLRQADDVADLLGVHQQHHRVAADTAADRRVGLRLGRGVVGAAGAEVRRALQDRELQSLARERVATGGEPCVDGLGAVATCQPLGEAERHRVGVELAVRGEQLGPVDVGLARHDGCARRAVEGVLGGGLEERPLLLDDDEFVETGGELTDGVGGQRPHDVDLQDADAGTLEACVVQADRRERLTHVEVRLAGRQDADPVVGVPHHDAVEAVHPHVLLDEAQAGGGEVALERAEHRGEQLGGRLVGVRPGRDDDGRGVVEQVDRGRSVGHGRHDLHRGPQPTGPREGDGVAAQLEHLGGVSRVERRDRQVGQCALGCARHARRLRGGVVADECYDAAARGGAP